MNEQKLQLIKELKPEAIIELKFYDSRTHKKRNKIDIKKEYKYLLNLDIVLLTKLLETNIKVKSAEIGGINE